MPKKNWTEEERKAFGDKMRAAREAKTQMPEPTANILDVTQENLISEADLIERIRKMFDDGRTPSIIHVNSSQMMEIIDVSTRLDDTGYYFSPFGRHKLKPIPRKDIDESN